MGSYLPTAKKNRENRSQNIEVGISRNIEVDISRNIDFLRLAFLARNTDFLVCQDPNPSRVAPTLILRWENQLITKT